MHCLGNGGGGTEVPNTAPGSSKFSPAAIVLCLLCHEMENSPGFNYRHILPHILPLTPMWCVVSNVFRFKVGAPSEYDWLAPAGETNILHMKMEAARKISAIYFQ